MDISKKPLYVYKYAKWSMYATIIYFCFFFLPQIIAALAVSLGPLAAGLGKGYSSPAIASLQELQIRHRGNYTFTVTDQQASWVASLSLLGKISCISCILSFGSIK